MQFDQEQLRKAIVSLSIEKALLEIGVPVYEKVIKQLSKDYGCYLPDCYDHPEYLNQVLKKIFGGAHITIADAIKKQLNDHITEKPIDLFVTTIGS